MSDNAQKALAVVTSAAATAAASYFGIAKPAVDQGNRDMNANFTCRESRLEMKADRDYWREKYMELTE
jgi:hypothetical protein